jgi:hypothetical protein
MKAPREFPKIEEIQNCEFYCDSNCFNKLWMKILMEYEFSKNRLDKRLVLIYKALKAIIKWVSCLLNYQHNIYLAFNILNRWW